MMHISEVLAETFRHTHNPADLTAWVDSQPMPGQQELPFCHEVNSEFTSTARPGADWGTWESPIFCRFCGGPIEGAGCKYCGLEVPC